MLDFNDRTGGNDIRNERIVLASEELVGLNPPRNSLLCNKNWIISTEQNLFSPASEICLFIFHLSLAGLLHIFAQTSVLSFSFGPFSLLL